MGVTALLTLRWAVFPLALIIQQADRVYSIGRLNVYIIVFFYIATKLRFLFSEISPLIMTIDFNDSWTICNYLHDFVLLFN